jgi:RND family efflux transporter MFP subunit
VNHRDDGTDAEATETTEPRGRGWGGTVLTGLGILGIVILTGVAVAVIWLTEPEAQRETAVKRTPMLVEVTGVEVGRFTPVFTALGTVRPDQDVDLQPQVQGRVRTVDEAFVPGRIVAEGATLVRLDPADLRNQLAQRRSALAQAEADLALEKGRQAVARAERDQIDGPVSPDQEALILREPQLRSTRARLEAAEAAVRQAELDLSRTVIEAPFDAMVITRAASPGAQVGPGVSLGRLVGTRRFWVELTLPVARLRHLALDDGQGAGTPVRLRDRGAFPEGVHREGVLHSVVRQVDDRTRLARLLVAVDDPLALDSGTSGPPLTAGAFVEAHVDGAPLEGVVRLERAHLRKGDTVWTLEDGALRIRQVDVVVEDASYAYIRDGLDADARVVTTDLATVSEGAPLRLAEGEGEPSQEGDEGAHRLDGPEPGGRQPADVAAPPRRRLHGRGHAEGGPAVLRARRGAGLGPVPRRLSRGGGAGDPHARRGGRPGDPGHRRDDLHRPRGPPAPSPWSWWPAATGCGSTRTWTRR